jgi:septal ring-binding cell division protein DamX
MDKFKVKSRSARNKLAEAVSQGTGSGSLAVPPSTLAPLDNASTTGVNEGFPGTAARDFAAADDEHVKQPTMEPPTSLQSSVDAGKQVPLPLPHGSPAPMHSKWVYL